MHETIRTVALITKTNSVEAQTAAFKITKLLTDRGVKVFSVLALMIENSTSMTSDDLRIADLDLIFAIGGDGTTLRAFRIIQGKAPLFSMNVGGNRGILSDASIGSIDDVVNSILEGRYFYDSRLRLQASINGNFFPTALNDIVLTRMSLTRTPLFSIKLMDDELKQRMDGIIISTPTGSTGHSFSLGGPVLHEELNCLILSPIASINRMPQLVIPTSEIEIKSSHEVHLIIDGQEIFKVPAEQTVKISRSHINAIFIRLKKKGMRQLVKLGF